MVNISRTHVIKFIELVLAVVLVIMHFSSHLGLSNHSHIQTGTYVGFLIIFIGIFAVSVTGTPINRRIELYFCLVGAVLFIVSAVFIFNNEGNPAIKGSIAIIEGILLLIDGVFTFRGE